MRSLGTIMLVATLGVGSCAGGESWPEGWDIEDSKAVREYFAQNVSCLAVTGAPKGASVTVRDYLMSLEKYEREEDGIHLITRAYTSFRSTQGAMIVVEQIYPDARNDFTSRRFHIKITDFDLSLQKAEILHTNGNSFTEFWPRHPKVADPATRLLANTNDAGFVTADLCRLKYQSAKTTQP